MFTLSEISLNEYMDTRPNSPDDVMISYKGTITSELISSILDFVEARFREIKATAVVRRKIISVLVEALQNIFHHEKSDDGPPPEPEATVMVCHRGADYILITGNRVRAERAQELADRIRRINAMSRDELNSSYKHILATRQKSSPTGSGVGFIDIARRSGQKIDFGMQKVDEDHYFFTMEVKIAQ